MALAVVMLAVGCGGGDDDGGDAQGSDTTGVTDPAGGENGGGGGGGVKRIAFTPPGPQDDNTPRGNQWYVFLTEGQCKALLDDAARANPQDPPVILYRAAAEACTGQHAQAAQDLNRYLALDIEIDDEDCGRNFVIAFVRNVLDAVGSDPDADITFVPAGRRPPCAESGNGGSGGGGGNQGGDGTTTTTARRSTTTTEDTTS